MKRVLPQDAARDARAVDDVAPGIPQSAADSLADPSFANDLIAWQRQHGRHSLPWQNTTDAYRIWLSEIMLQQTQVAAVIPYYHKFLLRFPSVALLAAAPAEDVMSHWSGLGYYSRARNLHKCAQQVVALHGGVFPADPDLLAQLPGIGRSTAAAITAFAYGTRAAIMDGNVKRVFARVFGIATFPGERKTEEQLWKRAVALLPAAPGDGASAPDADNADADSMDMDAGAAYAADTKAADTRTADTRTADTGAAQVQARSRIDLESRAAMQAYTQGLMDLGATLCTRSRPACERCPLAPRCIALATGRTAELPLRKPSKATPQKHAVMLVIVDRDEVLLQQRPDSGIWGGLLSLPELDGFNADAPASGDAAISQVVQDAAIVQSVARFGEVGSTARLQPFSHGFTHFKLHVVPYQVTLRKRLEMAGEGGHVWLQIDRIEKAPLPAPIKKLLLSLFRRDDLFA